MVGLSPKISREREREKGKGKGKREKGRKETAVRKEGP